MANFSSSSWLSFIYRFDFISQKNSLDCPLYTGLTISISQKYSLDCPLYTGLTFTERFFRLFFIYMYSFDYIYFTEIFPGLYFIYRFDFISQKYSLNCPLYTGLTIYFTERFFRLFFIYSFDYIHFTERFFRLLYIQVWLYLLCPRNYWSGGILFYPCPSIRPFVRHTLVCPANSYSFWARPFTFCRQLVRTLKVCIFCGFWLSTIFYKIMDAWT